MAAPRVPKPVAPLVLAILLSVGGCAPDESPTEPSGAPSPSATATGGYRAIILPNLHPTITSGSASAINRYGVIVGYSTTSAGDLHAVRWKNGVIRDLGTLGGKLSIAQALNNRGQIVGYSERADGKTRAFLWDDGLMTDLGTPGGSHSAAYGIDRDGRVLVGGSDGSLGIWADGRITRLPLPPNSPTGCTPTAMDQAGRVIAHCLVGRNTKGYLWRPSGGRVNLGSFGGYPTWPTAINNSGEIVGYSHLSDGEFRPFIWHAGTMTDLTTQGVFSDMIPTGINADGVIVGNMNTGGGIILAFLVDHGTVIDLNSLVPGLGCCAFANGINAVGDVVGETNVDGHAVLWTRN